MKTSEQFKKPKKLTLLSPYSSKEININSQTLKKTGTSETWPNSSKNTKDTF
jgi:hypothetical protein